MHAQCWRLLLSHLPDRLLCKACAELARRHTCTTSLHALGPCRPAPRLSRLHSMACAAAAPGADTDVVRASRTSNKRNGGALFAMKSVGAVRAVGPTLALYTDQTKLVHLGNIE